MCGREAGEGRKQLCIWAGWVTRAIAATTSLRRSLPLAKSLDLEQRPTTTNLPDPATTGHHFPAASDRIPRTRSQNAAAQFPDDVPSNATTVHVLPGARGLPRPNEVALACMTEPLGMFGGSIGARFPKGCQNMCPACVMGNSTAPHLAISIPSDAKCGAAQPSKLFPACIRQPRFLRTSCLPTPSPPLAEYVMLSFPVAPSSSLRHTWVFGDTLDGWPFASASTAGHTARTMTTSIFEFTMQSRGAPAHSPPVYFNGSCWRVALTFPSSCAPHTHQTAPTPAREVRKPGNSRQGQSWKRSPFRSARPDRSCTELVDVPAC